MALRPCRTKHSRPGCGSARVGGIAHFRCPRCGHAAADQDARVDWLKLHAALQTHPKWLGLSMAERGAWATLILVASTGRPRFRIRDRATATLLLARDGAADPERLLDRLVGAQLIDDLDDQGLEFHDWMDWQLSASQRPDATRARKREQRSREVTASHEESRVPTAERQMDRPETPETPPASITADDASVTEDELRSWVESANPGVQRAAVAALRQRGLIADTMDKA